LEEENDSRERVSQIQSEPNSDVLELKIKIWFRSQAQGNIDLYTDFLHVKI